MALAGRSRGGATHINVDYLYNEAMQMAAKIEERLFNIERATQNLSRVKRQAKSRKKNCRGKAQEI